MKDVLTIVDKKDEIIGWGVKSEIEYLGMSFRCVHILVFINYEKIIIPIFNINKKKFPNMRTSSAVGHVKQFEDYKIAAKRVIWESLGIKTDNLIEIGNFDIQYKNCIVFHKVYKTSIYNEKDIMINPLEFQGYKKMKINEIEKDLEKNNHSYTLAFKKSFEFINTSYSFKRR